MHDYYGGDVSFIYSPSTLNSRRTRGGPLTLNPQSTSFELNLYTDNRKWWVLNFNGEVTTGDDEGSKAISTNVEFKVLPTLTVSVGPEFSKDILSAQWIGNFDDAAATATYSKRYVFAHLDQTVVSANIRADWIMSPTLSFQVYAQPFIASGKFTDYKYLVKPKNYSFINYGENGSALTTNRSANGDISSYTLDPDKDGPAPSQTINNPDFNYISLRGNAVLRWEYLPGSTLYLVWTQTREDIESYGDFRFGHSIKNLFNVKPDNIFMLKISYWL